MAAKRLNNFVTELVRIDEAARGSYAFSVEHETWLFVRVTSDEPVAVALNGEPESLSVPEAMRFVGPGNHSISIDSPVSRLEIRAIPEIMYCSFPYHPLVYRMGPYDWAFLEKQVLLHVTTVVGTRGRDQSRYAIPWCAQGKRWIVQVQAPGIKTGIAPPIADIVREFTGRFDETPYLDGILIDEYFPRLKDIFDPSAEALSRIGADPAYAGRRVDPFVAGDQEEMASFVRRVFDAGSRIAFEAYNHEQPTEEEAEAYLEKRLSRTLRGYQKLDAEANRKVFIALGILSTAPETLNVNPHVNYKVFQDMEFHHLATAPDCKDVFGVFGYTAGYAEDETIHWLGRLYRHYCIEGNTTRLSADPYILGTVENADFDDGTNGWTVLPAESGSIEVREVDRFGHMAGRMDRSGNHCLVMKRSDRRPNAVSQTIRNLTPGRLYCLRMYSCNLERASGYGNPTFGDWHTLRIDIEDVRHVPEKSFQHVYLSIHAGDQPKMYYNFHFKQFRPNSTTAELTISDWKSSTDRHGEVDALTAFNFVEVAPYLDFER
jgi:hypothetical protein